MANRLNPMQQMPHDRQALMVAAGRWAAAAVQQQQQSGTGAGAGRQREAVGTEEPHSTQQKKRSGAYLFDAATASRVARTAMASAPAPE
jgi:hypothetical protein